MRCQSEQSDGVRGHKMKDFTQVTVSGRQNTQVPTHIYCRKDLRLLHQQLQVANLWLAKAGYCGVANLPFPCSG